jgi:dipeptidase
MAEAHRILGDADKLAGDLLEMKADPRVVIDSANQELADMLKRETDDVLGKVLIETSNLMKNAYARSDA